VRLYEFASLLGTPVWQTRISDCDLIGYAVSILPRHTTTVQIPRAILTTFLADSLPAGRYYAAVTWRPSLAARVQLIPAGPVVISKTR
jgi:hypothetical protein